MPIDAAAIRRVLDQTLTWSREQDYREYTKHDALNSPLLSALFGHHRLTRILATQAVMRFPFNVRPLLGVPRSENPKGLALWVMALLDGYQTFGEERYRAEAERLLERLLSLRSPGEWHGDCWGYQYPWQDLGFFAPKATPNAVVTAFVCEAFLHACRVTGDERYLAPACSAVGFFLNDLRVLWDTPDELCLGYMPLPMTMRVMDVSVLIAAVLAALAALENNKSLRRTALRLARYVARRQTAGGAWYYTDPPEDSPVKIDNYHTGFILDALDRVMMRLAVDEWREQHRRGAAFYAEHLFNADGSPRWMSDRDYPHDIHGAAQGILTFSQPDLGRTFPGLAPRVVEWALTRMYDPEGRFYYQQTRFYTKKFTFLRWCNAWMCRALAFYLLHRRHEKIEPVAPEIKTGLTRHIQDFWSRRVNAEFIMGRAVTTHARGDDAYFDDLETQRYRSHRHLPPWIAAMTPGKTVLEIGSGVGLDTFTMARHGLQVTAVDLTEVAVKTARQRFERHEVPASFLVADACHLPFPDHVFDYVYSFGVLHHVADTEASIREVHRLLKPGGQARIMLYHRHSLNEGVHRLLGVPFEDKDELCPVVRRFTVAEVRELFHQFSHVEVGIEYVYGEGYGRLFRLTPRWLYDGLSRRWGWHLMIAATK